MKIEFWKSDIRIGRAMIPSIMQEHRLLFWEHSRTISSFTLHHFISNCFDGWIYALGESTLLAVLTILKQELFEIGFYFNLFIIYVNLLHIYHFISKHLKCFFILGKKDSKSDDCLMHAILCISGFITGIFSLLSLLSV